MIELTISDFFEICATICGGAFAAGYIIGSLMESIENIKKK